MRIYGAERLPRNVIITYQPFLTTILEKKIASNITESSGLGQRQLTIPEVKEC